MTPIREFVSFRCLEEPEKYATDEEIDKTYQSILPRLLHRQSTKAENTTLVKLMDLLGNPQEALKVIHVSGTNGKGSVCQKIAVTLRLFGENNSINGGTTKIGLFTSPHISSIRERIKVNEVPISKLDFIKTFYMVLQAAKSLDTEVSFFEMLTAMMFVYFYEGPGMLTNNVIQTEKKVPYCDYCVIEVGLGGRLDATNIVLRPICCVIVSVGWDHMNILGSTLEEIGREKAGILKKGVPVVLGPQASDIQSINDKVEELQCFPVVKVAVRSNTSFDNENIQIARAALGLLGVKNLESDSFGKGLLSEAPYRKYSLPTRQLSASLVAVENLLGTPCKSGAIDMWCQFFCVVAVPKAVILDVGHNETALARVVSELQNDFEAQTMRIVVSLSKNRGANCLRNICSVFSKDKRDLLLGIHYLETSHFRIQSISDILKELADDCDVETSRLLMQSQGDLVNKFLPAHHYRASQSAIDALSSDGHSLLKEQVPFDVAISSLFRQCGEENAVLLICGSVFIMQNVAHAFNLPLHIEDSMDTNERSLPTMSRNS